MLFDKREQFKKEHDNFLKDTNKLIREARHSRGFKLIREDTQVIDYLEGKRKFQDLTPAERKLAIYLKDWFKKAEPIMTNKNARENYVTHIKRGVVQKFGIKKDFGRVSKVYSKKKIRIGNPR